MKDIRQFPEVSKNISEVYFFKKSLNNKFVVADVVLGQIANVHFI